jgi:hypothetical protein
MASEGIRGKGRKHHWCEFPTGFQKSPWRPQIFGLVEAHWIARLASQFDRDCTFSSAAGNAGFWALLTRSVICFAAPRCFGEAYLPSRAVGVPPQIMRATAKKSRRSWCLALWAVLPLLILDRPLLAQATIDTGIVVRTVSDPSGAVINGAEVTITNVASPWGGGSL